jgi:hypothetical protein
MTYLRIVLQANGAMRSVVLQSLPWEESDRGRIRTPCSNRASTKLPSRCRCPVQIARAVANQSIMGIGTFGAIESRQRLDRVAPSGQLEHRAIV